MKACVLEAVGDLRYKDVSDPKPAEGEVLLHVKACGICSSDIDRVFKTGTYHFPTIPGHEFSGVIEALGEGVGEEYLNKRAAVFPLLPCFHCPSCEAGAYARCEHYSYFGSRCDGAFAEYIAVPVWNLVLFPDTLSYTAAAMCEPAAVSLHAVNTAGDVAGRTVVVVGSGTIGLLAAMWARIRGAGRVIVVGRGAERLAVAKSLGFEDTLSTQHDDVEDRIGTLTGGLGADITIELAGSPATIAGAIRYVKKGGTVVLTGNPSGDITLSRNDYWKILRGEVTVKGTWNSSYSQKQNDWFEALKYMENGMLPVERLITHRFPLERFEEAFAVLRDRKSMAVKVMFEMNA